jgi:hypothetical protein
MYCLGEVGLSEGAAWEKSEVRRRVMKSLGDVGPGN